MTQLQAKAAAQQLCAHMVGVRVFARRVVCKLLTFAGRPEQPLRCDARVVHGPACRGGHDVFEVGYLADGELGSRRRTWIGVNFDAALADMTRDLTANRG